MGDPHRLLSRTSDGDDLERDLLQSIQRADPPEHAKAEAWARLSAQIAAVALVSSAHCTAAASTGAAQGAKAAAGVGAKSAALPVAFKLLGTKAFIAIAVAGIAAVGASALWLHARGAPAPRAAVTRVAAVMPAAEPSAPAQAAPTNAVPTDTTDTAPVAAPDAVRPAADQRRRDLLSAESALLTRARAELRRGDAAGAQRLLSRLQAQFPKGVLGQEREVLAIEVLAARGNAAAAKRRAQAFIAAYPESPHSAQLSRFADAP